MADKMIQVKLVRGLSGRKKDQIATVNALGLIGFRLKPCLKGICRSVERRNGG